MTIIRRVSLAGLVLAMTGCIAEPTPTFSPTERPTASPTATQSEAATPSAAATGLESPSATPEPSLSLDLPDASDPRVIEVQVEPAVDADGGTLLVTVTSGAEERIDELVLRWPTELAETLFLAPFTPSDDRIRDGGPPLVQEWTKWVIGPGEQGEPEGTISLGYGPLLAGATLEIPIVVARRAPGAVSFDLQLLAGNDLLTLGDGSPAELRVEVP